ncbi:MAG: PH domain-containing protein [Planctomycetes bacterium]|nr:PH domain-containing protein [Planctomycetota bacterium]MCB9886655.1 PH domain-containing protein [Planctomycetota bacterium]
MAASITAIVVSVILCGFAAMALRSSGEIDVDAQTFTMRYGAILKACIVVLLVCAAVMGCLPLFVEKFTWDVGAGLAAVPLLVAVPVAIEQRSTAVVTPDGVRTRSIWRGERSLAWADLEEVSFSGLSGWFTLRGRNGERLRIAGLFDGIRTFARILETHRPDCGGVRAVAKWRAALRSMGMQAD